MAVTTDTVLAEAPFEDARELGAPAECADSPWVVMKFGGSSLSSRQDWERIAALIGNRMQAGLRPLVVCSAVAGVSRFPTARRPTMPRWPAWRAWRRASTPPPSWPR